MADLYIIIVQIFIFAKNSAESSLKATNESVSKRFKIVVA